MLLNSYPFRAWWVWQPFPCGETLTISYLGPSFFRGAHAQLNPIYLPSLCPHRKSYTSPTPFFLHTGSSQKPRREVWERARLTASSVHRPIASLGVGFRLAWRHKYLHTEAVQQPRSHVKCGKIVLAIISVISKSSCRTSHFALPWYRCLLPFTTHHWPCTHSSHMILVSSLGGFDRTPWPPPPPLLQLRAWLNKWVQLSQTFVAPMHTSQQCRM